MLSGRPQLTLYSTVELTAEKPTYNKNQTKVLPDGSNYYSKRALMDNFQSVTQVTAQAEARSSSELRML